jgi:poly(3-hydroxybutyrate) depolymerase
MKRMNGVSRSLLVVMATGLALTAATVRASDPQGHVPATAAATSSLATHAIESGGVERTYAAYVPASATGVTPRNLLLEIHGSGAARRSSGTSAASPDARARAG